MIISSLNSFVVVVVNISREPSSLVTVEPINTSRSVYVLPSIINVALLYVSLYLQVPEKSFNVEMMVKGEVKSDEEEYLIGNDNSKYINVDGYFSDG